MPAEGRSLTLTAESGVYLLISLRLKLAQARVLGKAYRIGNNSHAILVAIEDLSPEGQS